MTEVIELKVIEQDLTKITEGLLIHQVNCRGIMGGGVAAALRYTYPAVYDQYRKQIWNLGDVQFVQVSPQLWVCNLAGQYDLAAPGQQATNYDAVTTGLIKVREWLQERAAEGNPLQPYAPYEIGCGLGGGVWAEVAKILIEELPEVILCKRKRP